MKYIIFDSGPIISLSMNGLLYVLEKIKNDFNGKFIITPEVYKEVVDKPMKIKKFKLEAIKVKSLIEKGVFNLSNEFVENSKLKKETNEVLKNLNGSIRHIRTNEKITLIHEGEASCLAFSNLCNSENLIVVDERTTRILFENSDNLKNLIESKVHSELSVNKKLINQYGPYKFIRSSELIFYAYKNNLLEYGRGRDILDGLLYALKYNGTTISSRDIEYLKGLV